MVVVGISASTAQAVRQGTVGNKPTASVRPMLNKSLATHSVKEIKTQTAPFSSLALSPNAKIIPSVSKSVAAATLFESFEGWDGETVGWTPKNWSRDNKTDFNTWGMSGDTYFCSPTDGEYMAWVDLGWDIDDDGNLTVSDPRDEMLISPAFTPVIGDNLFFDLNYAAVFMFFDSFTGDFDFDNPIFNVQVLLSTDNGANWKVVWDAAENERNTEDNIDQYEDNAWYSNRVSLESYVGKSIKIAFRYTDRDGGDNVGLDNIAVRGLNPTALYKQPQGFFKAGMTQDWMSLTIDLLLGHAYDSTVWRNISSEADTYSWAFDNPDGSGTTITSTEKHPNMPYPYGMFNMPELTAEGGGNTSTYQWGTQEDRYLQAGGSLAISDESIVGVGNYDLSYNLAAYEDGDGGYLFGTNSDNMIDGVANYFEKPVHKYILDGVWAALSAFSFPANTEFTMVIHRVDEEGMLSDTIATATCKASDVKAYGDNDVFTMPFTKFITIDPDTKLEIENDYLEIEDAILIEIKGFNNIPGSKICFVSQQFDADPAAENNAYLFVSDPDRRLTYYSGHATSLLFNLEIAYSYLLADSYEFTVPTGGGEKTFNVTSYFSPDAWWLEEDLPDWLSDDLVFDENTWEIQYTLKAAPLPANITSRKVVVKILTYGADMSISVQQDKDINTGLSAVTITDTKVVNKNNRFDLSYTPDYSAVSVYTVSGQKLTSYSLPTTGTFSIPNGNYSKGVYLFNFTGAKGASSVKVMK